VNRRSFIKRIGGGAATLLASIYCPISLKERDNPLTRQFHFFPVRMCEYAPRMMYGINVTGIKEYVPPPILLEAAARERTKGALPRDEG